MQPNVPELFFWDGWQTVEETDASGTLVKQYVYGEGLDEVVRANLPDAADVDGDTNTAEKVDLFFHHNSLGSVVAVTDAAGTVKESYRYSAFGQPTIFNASGVEVSASAVKQPFMFTGARWDEESSLYQMRLRYYDPVAGRFVSRDPLGLWGDAAQNGNGQSYCGGDPVNFADPMGLDAGDIAMEQGRRAALAADAAAKAQAIVDRAVAMNNSARIRNAFQIKLVAAGTTINPNKIVGMVQRQLEANGKLQTYLNLVLNEAHAAGRNLNIVSWQDFLYSNTVNIHVIVSGSRFPAQTNFRGVVTGFWPAVPDRCIGMDASVFTYGDWTTDSFDEHYAAEKVIHEFFHLYLAFMTGKATSRKFNSPPDPYDEGKKVEDMIDWSLTGD